MRDDDVVVVSDPKLMKMGVCGGGTNHIYNSYRRRWSVCVCVRINQRSNILLGNRRRNRPSTTQWRILWAEKQSRVGHVYGPTISTAMMRMQT